MKKLNFDINPIIDGIINEKNLAKKDIKVKDVAKEVLENLPMYYIEIKSLKTQIKYILSSYKHYRFDNAIKTYVFCEIIEEVVCSTITDSSVVKEIVYLKYSNKFIINLNDNYYVYSDVDEYTANKIINANSYGTAYNKYLKGQFESQIIDL